MPGTLPTPPKHREQQLSLHNRPVMQLVDSSHATAICRQHPKAWSHVPLKCSIHHQQQQQHCTGVCICLDCIHAVPSCFIQVRVVGVHLVEVEAKPYLALVQETAPGGDLGWQIEDCDFHTGKRGAASMVRTEAGNARPNTK